MKRICVCVMTICLVALQAPLWAQESTNKFLIETDEASLPDLEAMVAAAGGSVFRRHPEINLTVAQSNDPAFAEILASFSGIRRVTRDLIVAWTPSAAQFARASAPAPSGHIVPDPTTAFFYPCQWNMHQIDAPGAWAQGEFGQGVKVAVLDTGTDPTHIDLAGRVDLANSTSMISAPTICDTVVPDMATFLDFRFHGTFVSGLIASNGLGIAGVAPDATIVAVKVLSCLGSGSFADVIAGILYATSVPGVEVINMSLGAYFPKNLPGGGALVSSLNQAVNFAGSQGVLVVSAAGNNGIDLDHDSNGTSVPAQSGSGIAAWAGDIDGNLAGYSNHGQSGARLGAGGGGSSASPLVPLPGCLLPAGGQGGIVSPCSTFSLFFGCGVASFLFGGSGTSFSAPLVSGVAALVDGKAGGAHNAGRLKTILQRTADDLGKKGADNLFGKGRVNADKAVQN